jgi:hypothetical protein
MKGALTNGGVLSRTFGFEYNTETGWEVQSGAKYSLDVCTPDCEGDGMNGFFSANVYCGFDANIHIDGANHGRVDTPHAEWYACHCQAADDGTLTAAGMLAMPWTGGDRESGDIGVPIVLSGDVAACSAVICGANYPRSMSCYI